MIKLEIYKNGFIYSYLQDTTCLILNLNDRLLDKCIATSFDFCNSFINMVILASSLNVKTFIFSTDK